MISIGVAAGMEPATKEGQAKLLTKLLLVQIIQSGLFMFNIQLQYYHFFLPSTDIDLTLSDKASAET